MKSIFFLFGIIFFLMQLPFLVSALEDEDMTLGGLELDKILNFGSALLATCLFVLTLLAYRRKESQRLLYVSIAFFLFAVKGFLLSSEIVVGDVGWLDPVASILDFAILFSFFFGIIRK